MVLHVYTGYLGYEEGRAETCSHGTLDGLKYVRKFATKVDLGDKSGKERAIPGELHVYGSSFLGVGVHQQELGFLTVSRFSLSFLLKTGKDGSSCTGGIGDWNHAFLSISHVLTCRSGLEMSIYHFT